FRPEPGQHPLGAGEPRQDQGRARGQPQHAGRGGGARLRLAPGLAARTRRAARDRDPEGTGGGRSDLAGLRPGPLHPARGTRCPGKRRAGPPARAGGAAEFPCGRRNHRRPRRQSVLARPGGRKMKTSSTILAAIVTAALGAYGYAMLAPTRVATSEHAADKKPEKPNDHVEQDEHGADRIRISDVKLAAAGVTLAEAASATLTDTLAFNGILRA